MSVDPDAPADPSVTGVGTGPVFDCPRCGRATEAEFYGPCARCHGELRLRYQAERTTGPVPDTRYEPKMNVTPNAVALRDD